LNGTSEGQSNKQRSEEDSHLWLMPLILATQEAEIRRIVVQSQHSNSLRDPILKKPITKKGW
jgi:hypothetical protein